MRYHLDSAPLIKRASKLMRSLIIIIQSPINPINQNKYFTITTSLREVRELKILKLDSLTNSKNNRSRWLKNSIQKLKRKPGMSPDFRKVRFNRSLRMNWPKLRLNSSRNKRFCFIKLKSLKRKRRSLKYCNQRSIQIEIFCLKKRQNLLKQTRHSEKMQRKHKEN